MYVLLGGSISFKFAFAQSLLSWSGLVLCLVISLGVVDIPQFPILALLCILSIWMSKPCYNPIKYIYHQTHRAVK